MLERTAYSYRDDPAVPPFPDDKPVIVFDGICVMCSAWVKFVLRHDTKRIYRLLHAQSELGTALYRHYGLNPIDYETNLLIENGRAYDRSTGSIRMCAGLGLPWSLAVVLRIFPRGLRDAVYEFVARNRYRWFGQTETCYLPDEADKARFLS